MNSGPRLLPFFCLALVLAPPVFAGPGHDHGEGALADSAGGSDTARLTEIQRANLGLDTVAIEDRVIEDTVVAYGRLALMPGRSAVVSSRVPARVVTMDVPPGGLVTQGQRILELESRQPGPPPPPFPLNSPMSGTVSQWLVRPGQQVEPQDALVEVVNLDRLHAVAELFESDLAAISARVADEGATSVRARVRPIGSIAEPLEAEFSYFGLEASAEAGRVPVYFEVDNAKGELRPGMRVAFDIVVQGGETPVLAVPTESIQGEFGDQFIWVQDWEDEGHFQKIPVLVGRNGGGWTQVESGQLVPDDRVVTRGAFALQYVGPGATTIPDTHHGHSHAGDSHDHGGKGHEAGAEGSHDHGAGEGHGHSHSSTPPAAVGAGAFGTWLTWTLAGTSAGLLVLLVLAVARRREPAGLPAAAAAEIERETTAGPDPHPHHETTR